MQAQKDKPSPALEGHFTVVGIEPGLVHVPYHGDVDLRTVSLELATRLHAEGFAYLKPIVKKPAKAAESNMG